MTDAVVVVSGMGCPLGQSIFKALSLSDLSLRIFTADADPYSVGLSWGYRSLILPRVDDPRFIELLCECLTSVGADALFVGTSVEQRPLAEAAATIQADTGTRVMGLSTEVLDVADDKLETARFLERHGFPFPRTLAGSDENLEKRAVDEVGFPLIIKPKRGRSAVGVEVVHDVAALRCALAARDDLDSLVVQQYLSSAAEEYTTGVYCDRHGKAVAALTLKRTLDFGLTYKAQSLPGSDAAADAGRIAEELGVRGSCNVQSRLEAGKFVTFEVNPRFSSTTGIRARFGLNEPDLAVREYVLGQDLPAVQLRGGYCLRHWEEAYFPEDHQFR